MPDMIKAAIVAVSPSRRRIGVHLVTQKLAHSSRNIVKEGRNDHNAIFVMRLEQ